MGEPSGDFIFFANLWSSFDNGLFLGWKLNYFLFSLINYGFSINVDWLSYSFVTIKLDWELYFLLLLYNNLFTGLWIGFVPYYKLFSLWIKLYIVCELNLFLCKVLLLSDVFTYLISLDEDLFDIYPYFLPRDLINYIFLFIWWLKLGAVEYIAVWDYFWSNNSFLVLSFYMLLSFILYFDTTVLLN